MIKIIFFDFDGVIVESTDIKTAAFAELFRSEGSAIAERVVRYHRENAGVSRFDKFRFIYDTILHRTLDDREFQRLGDRFSQLVRDAVVAAPFVKGAREFLSDFGSKYQMFIITGTPQVEIEHILSERRIDHLFAGVYGAPTAKVDAVGSVLKRSPLLPGEAVYVGDAMSDFHAARENAVWFIARIHPDDDLFDAVDCLKIQDLSNLEQIIQTGP